MTVRLSPDGVIELQGACPIEDAEVLLQHLLSAPEALIDWMACDSTHAAVIQVLMVARRPVRGSPRGRVLNEWIAPLIRA